MPESIKIAFHCFSNITDPGTYVAPDERLLRQAASWAACETAETLPVGHRFNFTEWWKIAEGEKLCEPFNIGEELVAGLLREVEAVCALLYTLVL